MSRAEHSSYLLAAQRPGSECLFALCTAHRNDGIEVVYQQAAFMAARWVVYDERM